MITNITADKNYLTSIHDTKLRCWLSGDSFLQIQKPFDLDFYELQVFQSLRPSSSSSSSSSSNNFKRRAYCSSRFFFCHSLKRKKDSNPTTTSPKNMMANVDPLLLLEVAWLAAFVLFLELDESSSENPGTNCREIVANNKSKLNDLQPEISLISFSLRVRLSLWKFSLWRDRSFFHSNHFLIDLIFKIES